VLALEEAQVAVVERIFAEYLNGAGDRAIAAGLNRDGVLCPSASRPEQNSHRLADGWQGSTVRSILENPRYTGYAVFGRWIRHEQLADPDDVAAGHVTRFRRSSAERVVRSRRPAHPAIVSVEEFTQAQLRRRSRATGGMRGIAKLERDRPAVGPYLLRGLVRCEPVDELVGFVTHGQHHAGLGDAVISLFLSDGGAAEEHLQLSDPALPLFLVGESPTRPGGTLHAQSCELDPGAVVGLLGQPDSWRVDRHWPVLLLVVIRGLDGHPIRPSLMDWANGIPDS
jgi:hypothetical protein